MKLGMVDPYIVAHYLIFAKNGKPHLEHVNQLPNQFSLKNRFKYTNFKQTINFFCQFNDAYLNDACKKQTR